MASDNLIFQFFTLSLQFSLGIVFILSVLPKWKHPGDFGQTVIRYKILPLKSSRIFAYLVILIETSLGASLLTGWFLDIFKIIGVFTLLSFLIAVGVNLKRGSAISCGCFGETSENISSRTIFRICFLLFGLVILIVSKGPSSLLYFHRSGNPVQGLLPIMFMGSFILIFGLWLLALPEIILLFSSTGTGQKNTNSGW